MPLILPDVDLHDFLFIQVVIHTFLTIVSGFWGLLSQFNIPLPIGLIGLWRWSVWLMRRIIGLWYQPTPNNSFRASTAVITPVYNEEPDLFRSALRSWAANGPDEIIAVIDHTDTDCMEQFRAFEAESAHLPIRLHMLITQTPGKRPALADGILAATSQIVFLVDSDTVWDPDVLPKALAPFTDAEVGGVTIRQRVLNPGSTAQRLFDVYLDIRYIDEIRFLTAFGDAVTCLSGRTAVYRRAVALTALDDLMEETFWGRPVISGDDKALTLAVQSRGWKVRYQGNTCVYTPGATEMKVFLKQRLRWARNSWRADLKALGSGWAWRKPLFAFHLCDRLLQPLTTLVAPLYLCFALYHGYWNAVLLLILWWTISRTIKIWPHLQRSWRNIRVLPWYIFFNYWSAVMKIYAFFTMNQQGWITRWSRGGKADAWMQSLRAAPSYLATAATVALVALFIQSLHSSANADEGGEATSSAISSATKPVDVDRTNALTTGTAAVALEPTILQVVPRHNVKPSQRITGNRATERIVTDAGDVVGGEVPGFVIDDESRVATTIDSWASAVEWEYNPAYAFTIATITKTNTAIGEASIMVYRATSDRSDQPELCILDGVADGLCRHYQLAPTQISAPLSAPVQEAEGWNLISAWWRMNVRPYLPAAPVQAAEQSVFVPSDPDKTYQRSDATLHPNLLCVTIDGEEDFCIEYDVE